MVAWDGQIITHEVHHVHYTSPLGQCGDGAALNGIASIHQKHPVGAVLRLKPLLIAGHRGVVVQAGMDIVGMEDYNGSLLVRPAAREVTTSPSSRTASRQNRQSFFIGCSFLLSYPRQVKGRGVFFLSRGSLLGKARQT